MALNGTPPVVLNVFKAFFLTSMGAQVYLLYQNPNFNRSLPQPDKIPKPATAPSTTAAADLSTTAAADPASE